MKNILNIWVFEMWKDVLLINYSNDYKVLLFIKKLNE